MKIFAHVDGGMSGGSRVRRPGSEDPHWRGYRISRTFWLFKAALNSTFLAFSGALNMLGPFWSFQGPSIDYFWLFQGPKKAPFWRFQGPENLRAFLEFSGA